MIKFDYLLFNLNYMKINKLFYRLLYQVLNNKKGLEKTLKSINKL